jgi:hypothetical protein
MSRVSTCSLALAFALWAVVAAQGERVPRIWDDGALRDWSTPIAALNVRPAHYSAAEYYAAPAVNLRTYPVYHPDSEPAGYWEWLQKQKPEPLVDATRMRTNADWIEAGERAFLEIDAVLMRTADPALIAHAREPRAFDGMFKSADGTAFGVRWVVTDRGLMLTTQACGACHVTIHPDNRVTVPGPRGTRRAERGRQAGVRGLPFTGPAGTARRLQMFYTDDSPGVGLWREFTTPWAPDERVERLATMTLEELQQRSGADRLAPSFSNGVFARANGSPFAATKIPDLMNLRYNRYLDATGTHRLRGPEDIARYAALVTGADPMEFGAHRILTAAQRHVRFRYADEVLYAIGMCLMSIEPPSNPDVAPAEVLARGEQIFRREGCVNCHVPPNYTNGKLTLAEGFRPPANHPNRDDIVAQTVGTDSDGALKTRKGTGFYKIPSLRGVWYRRSLLHDGSVTSLEELFDPARLAADYQSTGWNPPGVTMRSIKGHTFGLSLAAAEKNALLMFLRSL